MAGFLSFTLGLQANEFLKNMGLSAEKVLSFQALIEGVGKVAEGVWAQIEKGAALNDLSKRTGESVASLYMLQKGFHAAGVGAEGVAPMLFQMQKALGGVNEMGESTDDIFRKLGLSVGRLKGMSGAEAMEAILKSLGKLDRAGASKAASGIFGRMGGADALQMARSMGEVAEAMERAKTQAAVFDRMAEAFDAIEKGVQRVKQIFGPVFLGIAEGIEPALRKAVEWLNKIDLSKIGASIREVLLVVQQAFKEGKLYEMLTATFAASVEFFENIIINTIGNGAFWSGIWDQMVGTLQIEIGAIGTAFLKVAMVYQAAMLTAQDKISNTIANSPGLKLLATLMGVPGELFVGGQGKSFLQHYDDLRKAGNPIQDWLGNMFGSGVETRIQGLGKFGDVLSEAIANSSGPAQDRLKALYTELAAKVAPSGSKSEQRDGGTALDVGKDKSKFEATAWEKFGLVLGGGISGPMVENSRRTADNTGRTAEAIERLPERIAQALGPAMGIMNNPVHSLA